MKTNLKVYRIITIISFAMFASLYLAGCSDESEDQTPVAADYDIGNLSQTAGSVTAVTITPKTGKSRGTITIYYNGSKMLPQTAGAYTVTFDVAAAADWKAGSRLSAGTLTIAQSFNSVLDFVAWLDAQPPYPATAYIVNLKIDNEADFTTIRTTLNRNGNKYVYLDLSGSTITTIPNKAFASCLSLTSVTIPDSVTSIVDDAFYSCENLTSVIIGNGVTSIGSWVFNECWNLAAINVDSSNGNFASENGVLYNKTKTTLIWYPHPLGETDISFTIPNSVTNIGDLAFYCCINLTGVTIPDSVTSIGYSAFSYCTSLASVTIGNSVTSIGYWAFSHCTSLASVTIPNSVTSIGGWAFYCCTSLTSVTFATESNIADEGFESNAFPEGIYGYGGSTLKNAYYLGKAGTYTREAGGLTWKKQ